MATTAPTPTRPRAEAPLTLDEPAPKVLGRLDQVGLWGNLGISLLAPVGAVGVLVPVVGGPRLSFLAAAVSVVVGTVLGALLIGAAAAAGALSGQPAMVLLRGLFGGRLSYLPTAVNVAQLLGWTTFEVVVIASAAEQLSPWHAHVWPWVLAAGVLTALMTLRPLGAVRVLRRYALGAVVVAVTYLFVELARRPMPSLTAGSWHGFAAAADVTIAVAVSWVPLAADLTRHSRTARSAFTGALVGYTLTQVAGYVLGLLALVTVVSASDGSLQHDMFAAFIAVPVGWLAFAVLVARELDESFADAYSSVISLQNVWPWVDRRVFSVAVCALATALALLLGIGSYVDFIVLLASVLVPLAAVFLVDFYGGGGAATWDTRVDARSRPLMLAPWLVGFVVYQLVDPGSVTGWTSFWQSVAADLHVPDTSWLSASVASFVVAAVLTLPMTVHRRRQAARAGDPAGSVSGPAEGRVR